MDWNNVNLNSNYERGQNILDPYTFDILLLEVYCNLRVINKQTVTEHFEKELKRKIRSAREVFNANLDNIIQKANEERNME